MTKQKKRLYQLASMTLMREWAAAVDELKKSPEDKRLAEYTAGLEKEIEQIAKKLKKGLKKVRI